MKYEQYFNFFEEEDYEMVVSSFQTKRFWDIIYKEGHILEKIFWTIIGYIIRLKDLLRIPFYDGVFVNLWVTPLGLPFFERMVTLISNKVIYDLDDMIFLNSKNDRFIDKLKGNRKPITLIKNSNFVIVCTPKLEEFSRKLNKNVIDISSTFDMSRFKAVSDYKQYDTTTIGWTGTHSTLKYLDLLKGTIQNVAKKRNIRLVVICNKSFHLDGVDVENIKWTAENEIDDLHKIDIGLYPGLKDKWALGKSGLKALTYMAIGIPALATAWGANFRIIEHEVNGFLINEIEEWEDYIIRLIDDIDLRKDIGQAGRKAVTKNFSLEANKSKYLMAFNATYN